MLTAKGNGVGGMRKVMMCREVPIKDIAKECERTTLYPEINCGQPESYMVCEEVSEHEEALDEWGEPLEWGLAPECDD